MDPNIRHRIRTLRLRKGITTEELSKRMGISRPFYSQLEHGRRRMSVDYLEMIARILGVSVAELYREEKPSTTAGERPVPSEYKHLRSLNVARLRERVEPLLGAQTEDFLRCYLVWRRSSSNQRQDGAEPTHIPAEAGGGPLARKTVCGCERKER